MEVRSVFCVVGTEFIGVVSRHPEGPATGRFDSIVLGFLRLQANSELVSKVQAATARFLRQLSRFIFKKLKPLV